MKYAAFVLLTVFVVAQTKTHLSEPYAKAALLALKTIQGDDSAPEVRDGEIYGNRHTGQRIDEADAQARSVSEQSAQTALNTIYSAKLANNAQRALRRVAIELELENDPSYVKIHSADNGEDLARVMFVDPQMEKDSVMIGIRKREQACFAAMDALLRSRTFCQDTICL
jgi:hypothetical protein